MNVAKARWDIRMPQRFLPLRVAPAIRCRGSRAMCEPRRSSTPPIPHSDTGLTERHCLRSDTTNSISPGGTSIDQSDPEAPSVPRM